MVDIRAIQRPLKEQYRSDGDSASCKPCCIPRKSKPIGIQQVNHDL